MMNRAVGDRLYKEGTPALVELKIPKNLKNKEAAPHRECSSVMKAEVCPLTTKHSVVIVRGELLTKCWGTVEKKMFGRGFVEAWALNWALKGKLMREKRVWA